MDKPSYYVPYIGVTTSVITHVDFAIDVKFKAIQTKIKATISCRTSSTSTNLEDVSRSPVVIKHELKIKEIAIPNPSGGRNTASIRFHHRLIPDDTEWAKVIKSSTPSNVTIVHKSLRSERQYDVNAFVDEFLGFRPQTTKGLASISPDYNSDENSNYENDIEYPSRHSVKYQNRTYAVTSQEGQRLIRDYMVKGRKLPIENKTKQALDSLQHTEHKYAIRMHGYTKSDQFVIPDNVYISFKTLPGTLAWSFTRAGRPLFDVYEKDSRFSPSYADGRKKEYKAIHFPGDTIQDMGLSCKRGEGQRCGVYKYPFVPSGKFTDDIGMKYKQQDRFTKFSLRDLVNIMVEKIRPTKENPLAIFVTSCRKCSSDETYAQSWEQNAAARRRMGIQTVIPPDLDTTTRAGMAIAYATHKKLKLDKRMKKHGQQVKI